MERLVTKSELMELVESVMELVSEGEREAARERMEILLEIMESKRVRQAAS